MVADADTVYAVSERGEMLFSPLQGGIHNVLSAPQPGMKHVGREPPVSRQDQVEYIPAQQDAIIVPPSTPQFLRLK
jgi:hypothetical protein